MTKQFKFGDLVRRKTDGITCFVVRASLQHIWVVFEGYTMAEFCKAEDFELIPHPDTVRLDYIERVISIDGMVKREMRKGWVLVVNDDIELTSPKPLLRDAIDSAMELTSGKKP